jgi:hypothetical protein
MKSFSGFSEFALTRAQMKNVVGGSCYSKASGGVTQYTGNGSNKAAKNSGTNWCCDSCSSASWCYSGGVYYCR